MTVTTHIAEILRQGVWASLTGGWYYEPAHSIFCNTLHLYLWMVLLAVPLVIGLATAGTFSVTVLAGYTSFIGVLFVVLKVIVSYLHILFDTTEPIVTSRAQEGNELSNICDLHEDELRGLQSGGEPEEGIEMREMRRAERIEGRPARSRLLDAANARLAARRRVRIEFEPRDDNIGPMDVNDVEMEFRVRGTFMGRQVQDHERASVAKAIADMQEKARIIRTQEKREAEQNAQRKAAGLPRRFPALERTRALERMEKEGKTNQRSSTLSETTPAGMARKMSEPALSTESRRWDRRSSSDGGESSRVRRANSTFEPRRNQERGMLSQSSLTQARQNTNKSYPNKMSSDDEFPNKRLVKEGALAISSTSDNQAVSEASEVEGDMDQEVALYTSNWKASSPRVFGPQEPDEPCCSHDPPRSRVVTRPGTPIEPNREFDPETFGNIPSTSSAAWIPVVVSLNDSERPSTSTVARISDDKPGTSDGSTDLKGEITKFLEDLIDKHPETLDAIESVRLSRLGRAASRTHPVLRLANTHRHRTSPTTTATVLSDLAIKDGTHVAAGHEDTTQGALHSFQDEDGNWWTYSFDEHGSNTAQPLGSGPALMEMIQRERSHEPIAATPSSRIALDVLPESVYVSSEDEGEPGPSTSHQQGRVVQTTRRERALSSSSNESFTYIPSVPTTVMHAGTGTTATRSGSPIVPLSRGARNNMVAFANVASRLRSSLRQSSEERIRQTEMEQIIELLDRGRALNVNDRVARSSVSLHARILQMQERIFRLDSIDSNASSSHRPYQEMRMGLGGFPPFNPPSYGRGSSTMDFSTSSHSRPVPKRRYYYQMKMFPKTNKSFKLKLDRLAVAALFDRNRSLCSCVFDVLLACTVSLLAALVLCSGIFFDIGLVIFAFGVAGAHFSLLKSVQPDAASPIHGFNWLVAYSRPLYFCFLCAVVLVLHALADDPNNEKIPWNWNPYRFGDASNEMVLVAMRDLVATALLMLPIGFTLGWLPQVNTLSHHILEQLEIHVFGGTASFGVFSACVQTAKSVSVWLALVGLCHLAYMTNPTNTQTPAFSAFLALSVGMSYLLSRFSSNTQLTAVLLRSMWESVRSVVAPSGRFFGTANENNNDVTVDEKEEEETMVDPLPASLRNTVSLRARHDIFFATVISLGVFALHSTSVFTATRPYFMMVIVPFCILVGIFNHYLYLQMRTHTPWKLIAKPIIRSGEFAQYECVKEARLMGYERIHVWSQAIERNVLYPLLVVCQLCDSSWSLPLSRWLAPLIGMRLLRGGFCHPQLLYVPLTLSFLATRFDWAYHLPFGLDQYMSSPSAIFCVSFFLFAVIYPKWLEFYLKVSFIMAYVAPWQISWGSAFHAFAQPFSVPHSALILAQTIVSSIVSAPLNPFLGSSFFMTSYVRPVKFWERDYNTKRSDASNTRLASQIDRGPMLDDSNLNAVFYEHLTRSLQKSLAGDLLMGRWATSVEPGDCFILASFYLNCLVHIVEVGNGFVTFQLRGLEFRGTYCHQREVEAISEDQTEGTGFCCCSPGSLPGFLSLNTAWGLRWLAWEVVAAKYVIDGYSITDNSAVNLLQVHELRRLLVSLYVKCIIFYATTSSKLSTWLRNDTVRAALNPIVANPRYADVDPMFCGINDEDYDGAEAGISRQSFSDSYLNWINYCIQRRTETTPDETFDPEEVACLCYMLSLLGRRTLGTASHNRHSTAAESFLYGLHALFKGDFRIQCARDEWVFADVDLLRCGISPAVKMALKLHQDHFAATDDFDDACSLYNLITEHQAKLFISHEQDPAWRRAILSNTSSLLALRHMYDDGQDDYKIIMLNKMHLNMRVIKLNRECVRAFWAGQQQELIFLRNRNPERGSIQNARQVLRNMINSSADQPVGYPIYVSPLTTSFVDTHSQMAKIVGPPITIEGIGNCILRGWRNLRWYLGPSTSSSMGGQGGCPPTTAPSAPVGTRDHDDRASQSSSQAENSIVHMTADGTARVSLARRAGGDTPVPGKKTSTGNEVTPPVTTVKRVSVDRLVAPTDSSSEPDDYLVSIKDREGNFLWLEVTDTEHIYKYLSEPLNSTGMPLVEWPSEEIRQLANHKHWLGQPVVGMTGRVIFIWYPNDPNIKLRSHIGDRIYLITVPTLSNSLFAVGARGAKVMTETEIYDKITSDQQAEKNKATTTAEVRAQQVSTLAECEEEIEMETISSSHSQ